MESEACDRVKKRLFNICDQANVTQPKNKCGTNNVQGQQQEIGHSYEGEVQGESTYGSNPEGQNPRQSSRSELINRKDSQDKELWQTK